MRTYTLALSIVVHLLVLGILVVSPIFATTVLPEPRRAVELFMDVRPMPAVAVPAPPRASSARAATHGDAHAAPVVPPQTIAPETGLEPFDAGAPDGVPGGLSGGVPGSVLTNEAVPPPPPADKPAEPIRVGGAIQPPQKIRHVAPVYPSIAQSARVEGTVILEAVIGEDGRVRSLRVLRSVPLLDAAATDAVRQWQFTATRLNGEAVPVVMTVTVTFTLQR